MKTKLTILSVAALLFAASGNMEAAGSRGAQDERPGYRAEKRSGSRSEKGERNHDGSWLEEKLDLTDAQRQQLKEHRNQRNSERKEVFTSMREKEQALRGELAKDELDRQKVDAIIDEIAELHKRQLKQRTESLIELRSLLTDEQWETIRDQKRTGTKYPENKLEKRNRYKR